MLNKEIIHYVENYIIPYYDGFDKGHSRDHVKKVIENSLEIAKSFDVNLNMVYIIAAYHDVGILQGRENHEKNSAIYLMADENLKKWFHQDEIMTMKEAVEDHRASSNHEPRSLYGKIVADADRDIHYHTILYRTFQYGITKYPTLTFEQHFERVYEHIENKYGENGYLTLWLNSHQNVASLKEIRERLRSKEEMKKDFEQIYLQHK